MDYEPFTYYPPPAVDPGFDQGLESIGGLNPRGRRKLRRVWGCDEMWTRNGQQVPRYLGSRRLLNRNIKNPKTGLIEVVEVLQLWGKPRWYIEEWKAPDTFVPPASSYGKARETRAGRPLKEQLEIARMEAHGEIPLTTIPRPDPEEDWEARRYNYSIGPIERDGVTTLGVIAHDVLGPFPREGRYEYLCQLETTGGDYVQPDDFWLDVIRESLKRRENRRFVSIEAEVADQQAQMRTEWDEMWNAFQDRVERQLKIHAHRFNNPRANKGGSGNHMIILPGSNPGRDA
jgi:hypothetical protein